MVRVIFDPVFQKQFSKIKDRQTKAKILKQVSKISENPQIGKPMRYARKGTRELYIPPFRLSYAYHADCVELLDLYHKDEQ